MATLKVSNLTKNFGNTQVLKQINLEVSDGEFIVLLGPSGCGKSTLLNIIAGVPTLLVYVLAGKYFIRGLTAGSVKG